MGDDTSVRVAVRVRPLISREVIDMCHACTSVTAGEPQIWVGKEKAFTFDHVFDCPSEQETVYNSCVRQLIDGCFEGYNATVLAYGQTGSGKTYTMGTGYDLHVNPHEQGIIPRAVQHLFDGITARQQEARDQGNPPPDFKVNVQFMELYNEEIFDLLGPGKGTHDPGRNSVKIHEDSKGEIYTVGVTVKAVQNAEQVMKCLESGALSRTTASTQMNVQSSRSHAIFTLHIKQQRVVQLNVEDGDAEDEEEDNALAKVNGEGSSINEFETLTAKFHFVDLAGSERLKRTGATGDRAKEGISINCGLLALGNVISALGDASRKVLHVPYRDSKLTRLLQDSLGGNSRTLMIACVSPCDRDFMETLNTLKYANRAKNIKNRVTVNQDKSSQTITALRLEIQELKLELMEYKQGKRLVGEDGTEQVNDMFYENTMLQTENNNFRTRIKALQETIERLTVKNTELLAEQAAGAFVGHGDSDSDDSVKNLIQGYLKEVEELRTKLMESEEVCAQQRKQLQRYQARLSISGNTTVAVSGIYDIGCTVEETSVEDVLAEAKRDVENLKRKTKNLSSKASKEEEDSEKKSDADEDTAEISGNNESSDSEAEELEEDESIGKDLATLTTEISFKQKLIDQLEQSQRRLQTMRMHYEDKLMQLQQKIRETEIERDRILSNMSSAGASKDTDEKVRKIKNDFERKLSHLQGELKKMQSAKREHAKLMKNQSEYERQVRKLKQEMAEMKKAKVALVTKMKEESRRHQEAEKRRNRQIAQMLKESRQQENRIRSLEAQNRTKETVLKRRHEEMAALRRQARPMSQRVAGRVPLQNQAVRKVLFSPKVAKQRWQTLEKNIDKLVLTKQSVYTLEKDMERSLLEREKLTRYLEKMVRKRDRAREVGRDIQDLDDQIESMKANLDYLNENIRECQASILQVEETKDDTECLELDTVLSGMVDTQSRYMVEKLLHMAINQSLQAAQSKSKVQELEARLEQLEVSDAIHQDLLQHTMNRIQLETLAPPSWSEEPESAPSTRSSSPTDMSTSDALSQCTTATFARSKARRKTATPQELLYYQSPPVDMSLQSLSATTEGTGSDMTSSLMTSSAMTSSVFGDIPDSMIMSHPDGGCLNLGVDGNLQRVLSAPGSLKDAGIDATPPPSPPVNRKVRDNNVFSRLTSTSTNPLVKPDRGVISVFEGKPGYSRSSPLVCTHVAEGHSKAVLSLAVTDDVLFTASKDRTVKVWNLHTGQEIHCLRGHPDNVVAVRYCEYQRLTYSVSTAFIKVWDVRESPAKCIRTLFSSGQCSSGPVVAESASRSLQIPQGETRINTIELSPYGTLLFSAASNIVRIWDIRRFACVGKLAGGHQAAVMCMAVDEVDNDSSLVITGSKDHYIKVFEIPESGSGVLTPKVNLEPPHYDGIQCLAVYNDYLFSGSRDMCIKKWDLANRCHVLSLNQAHKDWICALNFMHNGTAPPVLLSGCRGGTLKMWNTENCSLVGELKAHGSQINAIATNSSCVFTASNNSDIKIWRTPGYYLEAEVCTEDAEGNSTKFGPGTG
ncbi:kinesin-like protein KIF21A isoform X3 [Dermacentor andersoni]|uniref:kinesin-like protein KIF21A isoform X3 n=1 Tax=Dermacentor andersoni TaxID=34620 RepID=UPI002155AE24|nr:kinesin-like protein KIF21A isoform X3 [Dermacentor andersoni]